MPESSIVLQDFLRVVCSASGSVTPVSRIWELAHYRALFSLTTGKSPGSIPNRYLSVRGCGSFAAVFLFAAVRFCRTWGPNPPAYGRKKDPHFCTILVQCNSL